MEYQKELGLARRAAQQAAEVLLREQRASVISQQGKDIKLRADKESEAVILRLLQAESPYPILSEEAGQVGSINTGGPYWVVDPLDGTMNYSRGNVCYSVSIGLWQGNEPILGVVVAPALAQELWGLMGVGSYCNGEPIHLQVAESKGQAILSTGFPVNRSYQSEDLNRFIRQVQAYKKVRMIGSAALGLAWLALGQFDVYLEEGNMLWDVAGGVAIFRAAGGIVDMVETEKSFCFNVQAATSRQLLP